MKMKVIAVSPGGEEYMPAHDQYARLAAPSNGSKHVPCEDVIVRVAGPGAGSTDLVFGPAGHLIRVENHPFVTPEAMGRKLAALAGIGPQ